MATLAPANENYQPKDQFDVDPADDEILNRAREAVNALLDKDVKIIDVPETLKNPLDVLFAHDQILNGGFVQLVVNADSLGILDLDHPETVEKFVQRLLNLTSEFGLEKLHTLILSCKDAVEIVGYSNIVHHAESIREDSESELLKKIVEIIDEPETIYYQQYSYFETYRHAANWLRRQPDALARLTNE